MMQEPYICINIVQPKTKIECAIFNLWRLKATGKYKALSVKHEGQGRGSEHVDVLLWSERKCTKSEFQESSAFKFLEMKKNLEPIGETEYYVTGWIPNIVKKANIFFISTIQKRIVADIRHVTRGEQQFLQQNEKL